jgi:hypothetical protein
VLTFVMLSRGDHLVGSMKHLLELAHGALLHRVADWSDNAVFPGSRPECCASGRSP